MKATTTRNAVVGHRCMILPPPPPPPPQRRLSLGCRGSQIAVLAVLGAVACLSALTLVEDKTMPWASPTRWIASQNFEKDNHYGDGAREAVAAAATAHKNLWEDSSTIPPWMKEYFDWHKTERAKLTRENWKSRRYLVSRCLDDDEYCGGAADRLKPLPYLIMLASRSKRLLFITWSRPAPLEEFLVPPVGGLNWTVPEVVDFKPHMRGRGNLRNRNDTGMVSSDQSSYWVDSDMFLVEARLCISVEGVAYNAGRPSSSREADFDRVYGDVWRVFFEPTPPLAAQISSAQATLHLTSNEYVSVHVRAQYYVNRKGDTKAVDNALRCAASLLPSVPIYIASDSIAATRRALEYGSNVLNRTVVAHLRDTEPLHLERGKDYLNHDPTKAAWQQHPPSAYYDTFVDLYLLGGGRCSAFGIGGYGHWASILLSQEGKRCAVRHTDRKCGMPPSRPRKG